MGQLFAQERTTEYANGISRAWTKIDEMASGFFHLLPNLAVAVVLFIVVWIVARLLQSAVQRWTADRQSSNVGIVIGRLTKWVVMFVGLMICVSIVSPSVGPGDVFAMLGVGSVAIGFAFKDILQNFLAGILILLNEPFRVGDSIIVAGHTGVVERIDTRSTILKTYDGQRVFVPNGEVFTNPVEVISAFPHRRKSCTVSIGFSDSIADAVTEIMEAIRSVAGSLEEPAPFVQVDGLGESGVNLKAFWWAKNEDYGTVGSEVLTRIKQRLDDAAIDIPFPTTVVLHREDADKKRSAE